MYSIYLTIYLLWWLSVFIIISEEGFHPTQDIPWFILFTIILFLFWILKYKFARDKKILSNAIDTSTKWAKRCKIEFGNDKRKALFGITQGGLYKDLRIESLEKLKEIDFDGYAIGGMAVGETQSQMFQILENFVKFL